MTVVNSISSRPQIEQAIKLASKATGTDFKYLLATANRESSLNPQAKSKTSSASGLFQFIDRTWLDMVRRYGSEVGLGELSNEITTSSRGSPAVADGQKKQEILALRHDPGISAFMAGKLTEESKTILENKLGRPANDKDLYLAHFFGASTAANFLGRLEQTPNVSASQHFPVQAKANRSVFYESGGSPKTVKQVYEHLTQKMQFDGSSETVVAGAYNASNFHHSLFSNLRPSIAPLVQASSDAPNLRPSQKHFLLSAEVVQALSELRIPQMARIEGEKDKDENAENQKAL